MAWRSSVPNKSPPTSSVPPPIIHMVRAASRSAGPKSSADHTHYVRPHPLDIRHKCAIRVGSIKCMCLHSDNTACQCNHSNQKIATQKLFLNKTHPNLYCTYLNYCCCCKHTQTHKQTKQTQITDTPSSYDNLHLDLNLNKFANNGCYLDQMIFINTSDHRVWT